MVEDLLAVERARAQRLWRDALSASIADGVERDEVIADALAEVSAVFADLAGFTTIAADLPARRVVRMLSALFVEIAAIAAEEGVEKVQTISDCYVAVVGAPSHVPDCAARALRLAQRMPTAPQGRDCFGQPIQSRSGV